jgi:hypothetical protein
MLYLNMTIMVLISTSMVIALQKIRSCLIKSGFRDRLSHCKLTLHALAFLLYIIVLVVASTISDPNKDFYLHWLICLIFGDGAFICLYMVLYHLGEKQKAPKVSTTTRETSSTTFKDFSYNENHEDQSKSHHHSRSSPSHQSLETANYPSPPLSSMNSSSSHMEELIEQIGDFDIRLWAQFVNSENRSKSHKSGHRVREDYQLI